MRSGGMNRSVVDKLTLHPRKFGYSARRVEIESNLVPLDQPRQC
jgi:hypothetical protein